MNQGLLFALVAVASSLFLLLRQSSAPLRVAAVLVSAIEAAIRAGLLQLHIAGISLSVALGAALTVLGGLIYLRTAGKASIAASTCLVFVGLVQTLSATGLVR